MTLSEHLYRQNEANVTTIDGNMVPYLDADYAATSRPFQKVIEKVEDFLAEYGSVHRGSGQFSQRSTAIYQEALGVISAFIGDNPDNPSYNVIPAQNTTHAVNMLTRLLTLNAPGHSSDGIDQFFVPVAEHSANDLPWRRQQDEANPFRPVIRIKTDEAGMIDLKDLERKIKSAKVEPEPKYNGLLTFTGASSITGAIADIKAITSIAKEHNVLTFVDAAQMVAHRDVDIGELGVDFMAFAGHKMYAPFGGGVLIGKKDIIEEWEPAIVGGGTIDFASKDEALPAKSFAKRFGAGTPNAVGIVALAVAAEMLKHEIGYDAVKAHEQELLDRAKQDFANLPDGIRVTAPLDYDADKKTAVFSFDVGEMSSNLFAARLANEHGIGVRQGPICQYELVADLLGLGPDAAQATLETIAKGNQNETYGVVRASFGMGSTPDEISRLADAIRDIAQTPERGAEYIEGKSGQYYPKNASPVQAPPTDFFQSLGRSR